MQILFATIRKNQVIIPHTIFFKEGVGKNKNVQMVMMEDLMTQHGTCLTTNICPVVTKYVITHVNQNKIVPYKNIPCINLYDDGTCIKAHILDNFAIQKWMNDISGYLCTIDWCYFPKFQNINFSEIPLRSMSIQNAGGASEISEALSMQYMHYLYNIDVFVPEMEVEYWADYKKCDYVMSYHMTNIGVSVTRAMNHPSKKEYTYDEAVILLNKKLYGLIIARNAVCKKHRFFKAILHIWCKNIATADNVKKAYIDLIDKDVNKTYSMVYVLCTVCPNNCIYTNKTI